MPSGCFLIYDDEWIADNWQSYRNWSKLCRAYNETHGTDISYNTFKSHCNRELSLNYHYSEEQQEWLKQHYPHLGYIKCAEEFNKVFNENRSPGALKVACKKLGLKVTEKRKKEAAAERNESFGINYEVGTIIRKTHNEPYIKTENGWKRLKDIAYGDKPPGHVIVHLDQNVDNFSRDNLVAIPRSISARMAKNKFWSSDPEITRTGIYCCKLEEALSNNYSS